MQYSVLFRIYLMIHYIVLRNNLVFFVYLNKTCRNQCNSQTDAICPNSILGIGISFNALLYPLAEKFQLQISEHCNSQTSVICCSVISPNSIIGIGISLRLCSILHYILQVRNKLVFLFILITNFNALQHLDRWHLLE